MTRHLMAVLLLGAPIPDGKALVVTVRSAGKVTCAVREAGAAPAAERLLNQTGGVAGTWRISPGEMLSCSGPGWEPVDVDWRRMPPPAQVTLNALPARNVGFEAGWGGADTVIEWRALEARGTRLLARRRDSIGGRLSIPVADQPRVIRLRPRGASPQSVFVPPGALPSAIHLPPPAMGGELFGLLPRVAFSPESLDLIGESGKTVTIRPGEGGILHVSGVAAGVYSLVPQYRGGIHGRALRIVIRPGETTEVIPFALPETGAVRIDLPEDFCRARPAYRVLLRPLTPEGSSPAASMGVPRFQGSPCRQEVQGLEEGTYEASLQSGGDGQDVLASSRFAAVKGTTTVVSLMPVVRVEGRVTFGPELPASGVTLRFEGGEARGSATSDEEGLYATTLAGPGEYRVSIQTSYGLPSVQFTRRLRVGPQRVDFDLGDGVIKARARREDGEPLAEPVLVTLIAKSGERIAGTWQPRDQEARFFGMAHGEYAVTASTASGLTSRTLTVEVSPQAPVAEVDLVLARHEQVLAVVDASGAPIGAARVLANDSPLESEAPGVFRLTGVAPAERLKVQAAGYVPVCRTLADKDVAEIRLVLQESSENVTVHFSPGSNWETAALVGLPGSDCPVSIDQVDMQAHVARDETTVVLRLASGTFSLEVGARSYPLMVPGGDLYVSPSE